MALSPPSTAHMGTPFHKSFGGTYGPNGPNSIASNEYHPARITIKPACIKNAIIDVKQFYRQLIFLSGFFHNTLTRYLHLERLFPEGDESVRQP
ncbi:hypothetical protein NKI25_22535 [Mesorhizobium sp. M0808]|uniref:hypothetical protein n=1 Tax=Mesorhizobium sp. M0808 TaxID=2957002 RepID=UPI003339D34F